MRKLGIIALCLLAIYGLARAADVENPFRPPAITCTNQFIRSIAVLTGVGTCATVNFASDGTGIVPAANGGAGTVNGVLSGNGSGAVSQGATSGLSDVTAPVAWTPSDQSGAGLALTVTDAIYYKIGKQITFIFSITYPSTANGSAMLIGGLPGTAYDSTDNDFVCALKSNTAIAADDRLFIVNNTTTFTVATINGAAPTNLQMSTGTIRGSCTYFTN